MILNVRALKSSTRRGRNRGGVSPPNRRPPVAPRLRRDAAATKERRGRRSFLGASSLLLLTSMLYAEQAKPVAFICASKGNYTEGAATLNSVLKPAGLKIERFTQWLPIGEYENYAAVVFAGSVPEPPEFDEKKKSKEHYDLYLKTIRGEAIELPDQPADVTVATGKSRPGTGAGEGLLVEDAAASDDPFEEQKPHIWTTWTDDLGRDALDAYVENGGVLLLLQTTPRVLSGQSPGALTGLFGFRLRAGSPPKRGHSVRITGEESPVTKPLGEALCHWGTGSAQMAGELRGAKVLAELVDADGKTLGPFATVNTVGRGKTYWFGVSPLQLLRAAVKNGPPAVSDSLRDCFDMVARAALQARPARTSIRRELWDNTPLGPDGGLDYSKADSWPVPEVPPLPPFEEVARRLAEQKPESSVLLAEKGEPKAVIVLPEQEDAAVDAAAEVLVSHLNRMLIRPDPDFNVRDLWARFSNAAKKKSEAEAQSRLLEMTEIGTGESGGEEQEEDDEDDDADMELGEETKRTGDDKPGPSKGSVFRCVRLPELGADLRSSERGLLPVEGNWEESNFILVGQFGFLKDLGAGLEELGPEGIRLKTAGNTVVVSGKDGAGIRHAVYAFLESLGCRYLWPGELGKVIPYRPTLHAPRLDLAESPQMCMRHLRTVSASSERCEAGLVRLGVSRKHYGEMAEAGSATLLKDRSWYRWQRLGIRDLILRGHSFTEYWEKHGEQRPEWFALQPTGIRDQAVSSTRPRFCHSNRELISQIVADSIATLAASPGQSGIALGLPDGGQTTFCLCRKCRSLDPANSPERSITDCSVGVQWRYDYRSLTDRVLWFSNEIAKGVSERFPDRYLSYDVYSAYSMPPVAVRPHPSILICCVPGSGIYLSDESRKTQFRFLAKWGSFGNPMFLRPNILLSNWRTVVPQNFARRLFYDFRFLHGRSMIGSDFDTILNHWSTMGLIYYVLARAHWNPESTTAEEMIADYCISGFGEAAGPVYDYFGELEAVTSDAAAKPTGIMHSYTPERLKRLRGHLSKAKETAGKSKDPYILHRVLFLEVGLDLAELTKAVADGGGRAERDRLKARAIQALEEYPLAIGTPYFGLMNYGWYR